MIEIVGDAPPERHKREGPTECVDLPCGRFISDACRCGWSRSWQAEGVESDRDLHTAADVGWRAHLKEIEHEENAGKLTGKATS